MQVPNEVAALALLGIAVAATLLIVGPARIWTMFGAADLGAVTFETLQRRSTPNDALACPPGLCPAKVDRSPPTFAVGAEALRRAVASVVASEPMVEQVAATVDPPTDRFVQRSALLRFPDTIVVRYIALPEGRSTLAIYSRSQLGHSDLGVNSARIDRWLAKLSREVQVVR